MSTASKNPPHPLIAREIRRGTVVPFLGAGVNFGGRPEAASWQMQAAFLPSGKELSGYFADLLEIQTPDPRDLEDLAKVTSYFVNVTGERKPCAMTCGKSSLNNTGHAVFTTILQKKPYRTSIIFPLTMNHQSKRRM